MKSFAEAGIPEFWIEHIIKAGYDTVEKLRETKPTAVHQNMNTYRKKNKLDIPAIQLSDVELWLMANG